MGKQMRSLLAVLTMASLVAFSASAEAQGMGAGMTQGLATAQPERPGGAPPPPREKPTKRANEKDYKSSLDRLPDQKYDPWAKTR